MMPCHLPNRRQLLELLSSGVAACCWSLTGRIDIAEADDIAGADDLERARQKLISLFSDRSRVHAIAAAYLGTLAREQASPATLTRAILGPMSISIAAGMTAPAIRQFIAERIQLDFLRDDMVCVDGWMLSRTEARLCALAATDGGSRPARSPI
jgi:hypothetical protein